MSMSRDTLLLKPQQVVIILLISLTQNCIYSISYYQLLNGITIHSNQIVDVEFYTSSVHR